MVKNDQELQQKYLQLQMIEAQLQQAEKELIAIETKHQEILAFKDSLGELKNFKLDSSTFSPLGLGIYAQGAIKNTKELLVNVGAGVMVKKKVEDVRSALDKQIAQFRLISANLVQNMQFLANQAQTLERDLVEKK